MQFESPYLPAILIRRYKRFLADVELADGRIITVHTPNTGAMLGLSTPGIRVWLRDTHNPLRKYRYSWEISEPAENLHVGVHTGLANVLVREAIENGVVTELQGYAHIEQEIAYGVERSRIDLLLRQGTEHCYIEIKNVTARDANAFAMFPDAVSLRGQKHLRELMHVVQQGQRGVMFYCIQRDDITAFRPADEIDRAYGELLRQAAAAGVEVLAYKARVTPVSITLTHAVPVHI